MNRSDIAEALDTLEVEAVKVERLMKLRAALRDVNVVMGLADTAKAEATQAQADRDKAQAEAARIQADVAEAQGKLAAVMADAEDAKRIAGERAEQIIAGAESTAKGILARAKADGEEMTAKVAADLHAAREGAKQAKAEAESARAEIAGKAGELAALEDKIAAAKAAIAAMLG